MEVMFGNFGEPDHGLFLMQQLEEMDKALNAPTQEYVRDRKAMANTPMDVKELPDGRILLTVDMPGIRANDIKVQVEDNNLLAINGERKRPAEEELEGKYLRMERRMGKFMRKFPLPDDANLDNIKAEYKDGVLNVSVERMPPPEPKNPRCIEIKVGGGAGGNIGDNNV